jgi:hypothetical protein
MPLRRAVDPSSYRQLQPVWQSLDAAHPPPSSRPRLRLAALDVSPGHAGKKQTKDADGHSAEHQHDIARGGCYR